MTLDNSEHPVAAAAQDNDGSMELISDDYSPSSSGDGLEPGPDPEFYDPDADDRDEKWVNRLRGDRHSDAILSCPQCFTTLCVECEQHVSRANQFRACRVLNCRINQEEPESFGREGSKRSRGAEDEAASHHDDAIERFMAVHCSICDYRVGVRSIEDGTYHFIDVFASNS